MDSSTDETMVPPGDVQSKSEKPESPSSGVMVCGDQGVDGIKHHQEAEAYKEQANAYFLSKPKN
jgi:hypothetical protein